MLWHSNIAWSLFYHDDIRTHKLFPLPTLIPILIALFIPHREEIDGCVPASKEKWKDISSTALILLFLVLLSVLHVIPVPQILPAVPSWVMELMHSTRVITFTWFLGAPAKIQTSKDHDMNRLFRETIVIFSSNTSTFILLLEQLLNSCVVY